jgi:hypothetical protein
MVKSKTRAGFGFCLYAGIFFPDFPEHPQTAITAHKIGAVITDARRGCVEDFREVKPKIIVLVLD